MATPQHSTRARPSQGVRRGMLGLASRLRAWGVPRAQALYAVLGIWLVLAFAFAAFALWSFILLADEVMEGTTQGFDVAVLAWMNRHAHPELTDWALAITELGAFLVITVMGLVVSAVLWIQGQKRAVALLWVALLGDLLLNDLLKAFFARERPDVFEWRTLGTGGKSFPSGHSMNAMVAYTVFAFLIARLETTLALRTATFAVAGLIILLVGLSRVYLGVHYPSDVLAGFAVGFAWAMACVFAVYVPSQLRGRWRPFLPPPEPSS